MHCTEDNLMSKFDYPDPGQDPAYCNALTPEPDEPDVEVCAWCSEPLWDNREWHPYCSSPCALYAELDSVED